MLGWLTSYGGPQSIHGTSPQAIECVVRHKSGFQPINAKIERKIVL